MFIGVRISIVKNAVRYEEIVTDGRADFNIRMRMRKGGTPICDNDAGRAVPFQTRRRIMYVAVPAMMLTSGLRQKS